MKRNPRVLAIMSPKGGVGKTVTTANLAAALSTEFNKKVLAIDTNVSTASLGLHLNILYPKTTINDISKKYSKIKRAIHSYSDKLHVIPASIKIKKKDKDVKDFRANIHKMITNYENVLNKLAEEYDLVLLDCSPGFDIEGIAAMHVAGGLLLVTNPDYPSIVTAVKASEYAKLVGIPVGGVVLNKVTKKNHELTKDTIEKTLKMKVLQEIPFDKAIPKAIASKKPGVLFSPYSKSSIAYKKLAAPLVGEEYKYGFKKRLARYFGFVPLRKK